MKKVNFALAALALFLVVLSACGVAWNDCPTGQVNCAYPGDCSNYVDTDKDGICDRSQPAPEDR